MALQQNVSGTRFVEADCREVTLGPMLPYVSTT